MTIRRAQRKYIYIGTIKQFFSTMFTMNYVNCEYNLNYRKQLKIFSVCHMIPNKPEFLNKDYIYRVVYWQLIQTLWFGLRGYYFICSVSSLKQKLERKTDIYKLQSATYFLMNSFKNISSDLKHFFDHLVCVINHYCQNNMCDHVFFLVFISQLICDLSFSGQRQ